MKKVLVSLSYLLLTGKSQLVLPLTNDYDNQITIPLEISNHEREHEYKALNINVDTGSCDLVF